MRRAGLTFMLLSAAITLTGCGTSNDDVQASSANEASAQATEGSKFEPASPISTSYYQPGLDITKDPGCGRKLESKADRVAHNKKLAELYFLNYQQDRERGRNYAWYNFGCWEKDATVLLGAVDPLGAPAPRTAASLASRQSGELSGEQRGYFAHFPDWGTVPKSLVVIPFEEGAYFRMMYAGTSKDDGKRYTIWETNLILVNDEGRITHFEMWNDSIGFDATTRKIFGKSIVNLGYQGYYRTYDAFPKERHRKSD